VELIANPNEKHAAVTDKNLTPENKPGTNQSKRPSAATGASTRDSLTGKKDI